jgi:hypothetical protein
VAAEVAAAGVAVAAGVEAVTGAVGLLEFTVGVVAGMAEAVGIMVAWPTWVMGGVAMQ